MQILYILSSLTDLVKTTKLNLASELPRRNLFTFFCLGTMDKNSNVHILPPEVRKIIVEHGVEHSSFSEINNITPHKDDAKNTRFMTQEAATHELKNAAHGSFLLTFSHGKDKHINLCFKAADGIKHCF